MESKTASSCLSGPFWSSQRPRTHRTGRTAVRCTAQAEQNCSRRAAALLFAGLPALAAPAARALLPAEDQEDEELVGIAKSRRKERLAEERKVEKSFVKKGDYGGVDLSSVQNAVNTLAKDGLTLEKGDLKSLAATSDSWVADLKEAIGDLSSSSAAQSSSSKVLSTLDALSASFKKGDLEQAKEKFGSAVSALSSWIGDAGLTNQIKGL